MHANHVVAPSNKALYQYSVLTAEHQQRLAAQVLTSGDLGAIGGTLVTRLEHTLARHLGRRAAIATASATAGLELAIRAITGPNTSDPDRTLVIPECGWVSVGAAAVHCGAGVRIAAVSDDLTCHWEHIAPLIDARTAAVVLAHLRGRAAPDTPRIAAELRTRGIPLIEDCAQAWGVTVAGRPAGAWADLAVFSTQAFKLIATGEGGLVTCDDQELLQVMRGLGGDTRVRLGERVWRGNCRMSELTAAAALPQLTHLDTLTASLRGLQRRLVQALRTLDTVHTVLPGLDECDASNGSLVGLWMTHPTAAEIASRVLRQAGFRCWQPSPGDLHLAAAWPVCAVEGNHLDVSRYLDVQVPLLAEEHQQHFVDAVVAALNHGSGS